MKVHQICDTSSVSNAIRPVHKTGKITKSKEEDVEIVLYLEKLSHLLPQDNDNSRASSPTNFKSKQSRLEIIQSVIDYICDLQEVLEVDHQKDMDLIEYETSSITLAA